jgi:hypothetical protein
MLPNTIRPWLPGVLAIALSLVTLLLMLGYSAGGFGRSSWAVDLRLWTGLASFAAALVSLACRPLWLAAVALVFGAIGLIVGVLII